MPPIHLVTIGLRLRTIAAGFDVVYPSLGRIPVTDGLQIRNKVLVIFVIHVEVAIRRPSLVATPIRPVFYPVFLLSTRFSVTEIALPNARVCRTRDQP